MTWTYIFDTHVLWVLNGPHNKGTYLLLPLNWVLLPAEKKDDT